MLKKLTIENFRNITEEIEIKFSKITLLFGMNNVGKSSIVSALDILKNIDSKLDVPLITDLANYGSINNLYSKHNNKNYFKIKFDLITKEKETKDQLIKSYFLNYSSKKNKIIKNIISYENDKKVIELKTDGNDFISFVNLLTNSKFDRAINDFFKDKIFASEYFNNNLKSFLQSIPSIKKLLDFELCNSIMIENYNESNPNDIQINRSDLFNYIKVLNSNVKFSLDSFFETIKKDENINQIVFDVFKKSAESDFSYFGNKDLSEILTILTPEDFDPFDYQNVRLTDYEQVNDFGLLYFKMNSLFRLCFDNKINDINENFSIHEGLLRLIFNFYFIENYLKKPITSLIEKMRVKSVINSITLKDREDHNLYLKQLDQVEQFSNTFLKDGNQVIDKELLIDNLYNTPEKLAQDNFIVMLGNRMLAPSFKYEFSIFNLFKKFINREALSNLRRQDFYMDLDPSFYLRDFYADLPMSQIYLGEDTSQRIFTYNNSNSFYDLLYLNRKNINLLTKISDEIRKLGFDVNEIKIESEDNTYRIKIISSKSATDLIDCGKGIKRIISILSQIYCNKEKEEKFLAPRPAIVCIEEPEANIHPKIQSELGSMLSNSIQQNIAKQILIETHSENLTLRLLKLIREKKLNPEDVAINCLYMDENQIVRSKHINILGNGDILDEWPDGFFEESLDEII